ncbi:MAG: tetratricopeptide repeat protein [Proteobacteria bacterium]|nr:tetratricopeptide repeat protein [Pseudomonadota bacterium]
MICPKCSQRIGDSATYCNLCGYVFARSSRIGAWAIGIVILLAGLGLLGYSELIGKGGVESLETTFREAGRKIEDHVTSLLERIEEKNTGRPEAKFKPRTPREVIERTTERIDSGRIEGEELSLAYRDRANAWRNLNKYDKALADYSKVVELAPDDAKAYRDRANTWLKLKKNDEALADFSRAVELAPDDARIYRGRGYVYRIKGELDLAIADYTKAVELRPDYPMAYVNRGYAWRQKGEPDQAIADFTRAIDLDPEYALAYMQRAWDYQKRGDYTAALEDYDRAIKFRPKHAPLYWNRSAVLEKLGRLPEAAADMKKYLEIKPKDKRAAERLKSLETARAGG